jgi:hypothetical protein
MTAWTEINNIATNWTDIGDKTTTYAEVDDVDTQWGLSGGLIRLCTEGFREDMMTEARGDYIVVSHGEDVEIWTDTADISSAWTKINDI